MPVIPYQKKSVLQLFPYKSEVWGQMNQTNNVHAMCGGWGGGSGGGEETKPTKEYEETNLRFILLKYR